MAKRKPSNATDLKATDAGTLYDPALLNDVRRLIATTKEQTARIVNSGLVMMYWFIGRRIQQDVLKNERAEYGKEILQTLSEKLTEEFGRGFSRANLSSMLRFAEVFPTEQIVLSLSAQLSWSHFVELIPLEEKLKREFYAELCRVERWSVRTLRHKMGHLLYERTAVSKKPDALIEQDITALRDEDRLNLVHIENRSFSTSGSSSNLGHRRSISARGDWLMCSRKVRQAVCRASRVAWHWCCNTHSRIHFHNPSMGLKSGL